MKTNKDNYLQKTIYGRPYGLEIMASNEQKTGERIVRNVAMKQRRPPYKSLKD